MSTSAAIVAGGQSRRMGTDKSRMVLGGKMVLQHVIDHLQQLNVADLFLVSNNHDAHRAFGLPIVADVMPGKGALGGIYTALTYSNTSHTLVVACDMPFLSVPILQHMLDATTDTHDVVVPLKNNYPEGLHAIYSQRCLSAIEKRLLQNKLKVIGFYDDVRVHYLEAAVLQNIDDVERAFFNVNTPDELEQAHRIVEGNQLDTTTR